MKKLYVYNAILCGAMITTSVNAASVCSSFGGDIIQMASWTGFCPNGNGGRMYVSPTSDPWANCGTKGYWCYYNEAGQVVTVPTCITCMSGFSQEGGTLAAANSNGVCSNDITYYKCVVQSSSTTPTCDKTTCEANNNTYYKYNDAYEISYKYNCSNNQCVRNSIVTYRCATGYYGTSGSLSMAGCTRCPAVRDNNGNYVYGATQGGGKTSKTDCFVPVGTVMSDGSGDYVFTNMCKYTE